MLKRYFVYFLASMNVLFLSDVNGAEEKCWSGDIELSVGIQSGNTEKEHYRLHSDVAYTKNRWENSTHLKFVNGRENSVTSDNNFRLRNKTQYKFAVCQYVFFEAEYVYDRFSSFDYRVAELLGYGIYIIQKEDMDLSFECGMGSRQSRLLNGEQDVTYVAKFSEIFEWEANDYLTWGETLSSSLSPQAIITEFNCFLKYHINQSLYLKLSIELEHNSDALPTKKSLDTGTYLLAGYDI
ncbi:MAG: hypothetical protein CMO81_01475 [Waddliaceae bacterium]|nr:hypothetical protein [Waddliaceae bacterium]